MYFLYEQLRQLKQSGLLRQFKTISRIEGSRVRIGNKWYISFCSNDYLGLAQHPKVKQSAIKAVRQFGAGSGASRLMAGTYSLHAELEKAIARFKSAEDALLFTSGYVGNLAVITTLIKETDIVFSDEFNHASLIDAIRLTRAKSLVYRHRDINHLGTLLKKQGKPNPQSAISNPQLYIITDAVFSMDGDCAPLAEIVRLSRQYQCRIIVDEAHATGVLGKHGRGLAEQLNLEAKIDISLGTLSKAAGVMGGFVTGTKSFIAYLRSKGRPFIFTTALPPAACAGAIEAIKIIRQNPDLRSQLLAKTDYIKNKLSAAGFDLQDSGSPIIPILIGDPHKTLKVSHDLWNKGFFIPAIRPPTVPADKSRLRITVTALHTKKQLDTLITHLFECKRRYGL